MEAEAPPGWFQRAWRWPRRRDPVSRFLRAGIMATAPAPMLSRMKSESWPSDSGTSKRQVPRSARCAASGRPATAAGNRNSSVAPPLGARPGDPEYAVERFHGNPTVVYYWRIARPPYSWHCSARKNKRSRPRDSRGGETGSDRTRIPKSEKDLRRSPSRPGQRPLSRSGASKKGICIGTDIFILILTAVFSLPMGSRHSVVMAAPAGNARMREISGAVQEAPRLV